MLSVERVNCGYNIFTKKDFNNITVIVITATFTQTLLRFVCKCVCKLPLYLFLSPHHSPGRWGRAEVYGHHVHASLSWPRPWVPAVPGRVWGGGGRRGQGEGVRQRQRSGKHPRVRHLGRADQTWRQRRRTGGSLFPWGEVSFVSSLFFYFCFTVSTYVHLRWCSLFQCCIQWRLSFMGTNVCFYSAWWSSMLFSQSDSKILYQTKI